LSNYASLIGSAALWFLIIALIIFYGFDVGMFSRLLAASIIFLLPLILNRLGFIFISRILLCALVPLFVFGISILDLKAGEQMSAASFVGLRLFLLVGWCFPFLLFDLKERVLLIMGLAPPVLSILFFDRIFHFFGVGYTPDGKQDLFYEFSNVRALISAFAIGASLFFLKLVVENAEKLNQNLLVRLEDQNKLIKLQAEATEKRDKEKLSLNEANIKATINNTELMIWSVDKNFNLMSFNNQFADYVKKHYGVELTVGSGMFELQDIPESLGMIARWHAWYSRALAGHRITLEEVRFGIDFQYSLSPIVEGDEVIGVSVFADNVTERKARDRELAEANKKIGELKLMALRSVMSPHFIFNVLNSIQFFIAKNDRLNAINYLSTFSKLVRSILTHSVNNTIRLSDEIEMLQNYIELEMTRFENKFIFSITMDPEVKLEEASIVIPSLLVQPYVENAILHGLYNKPENGELSIRIKEQEGMIIFEIEDNGIGRAAAMELRKKHFPPHVSMGINITEERLKLINQSHQAAFEIEDLVNGDKACGTRVKIGIPYAAT
jgi:hypothetical protein